MSRARSARKRRLQAETRDWLYQEGARTAKTCQAARELLGREWWVFQPGARPLFQPNNKKHRLEVAA